MRDLDWVDIILHVVIAVVAIYILTALFKMPIWYFVAVNTLIWPVREGIQSAVRGDSINPFEWSKQKTLEWAAPDVAGLFTPLYLVF